MVMVVVVVIVRGGGHSEKRYKSDGSDFHLETQRVRERENNVNSEQRNI